MEKPILVTTKEREADDDFTGGMIGLIIVASITAGTYIYTNNLTIATIVGAACFIITCFVRWFRIGYLAISFTIVFGCLALGAISLIIWAIVKFSRNN